MMETIEDIADRWLRDNVPNATPEQHRALVLLLKQRDRDTRNSAGE